jgi:hypothetical protein
MSLYERLGRQAGISAALGAALTGHRDDTVTAAEPVG